MANPFYVESRARCFTDFVIPICRPRNGLPLYGQIGQLRLRAVRAACLVDTAPVEQHPFEMLTTDTVDDKAPGTTDRS